MDTTEIRIDWCLDPWSVYAGKESGPEDVEVREGACEESGEENSEEDGVKVHGAPRYEVGLEHAGVRANYRPHS